MGVDHSVVAGYGITLDIDSLKKSILKNIGEEVFTKKYYESIPELFWNSGHIFDLPDGFMFRDFGDWRYGGDLGVAILSSKDDFKRDFTSLFDWLKKFEIKANEEAPYLVKEMVVS